MAKRSGPGASLVGALVIVGVVGWVLSQIWVYLLIGATAGLLGWMGWMLSRSLSIPSLTARLVRTETPRAAALPEDRFRAVAAVDPHVFDDPVLAEAAALKTFAAWTHQLPMAPSDPAGVVRSLELRIRHVGRLVSEIVDRRLAWREAPYSGPAPVGPPPMAADSADAWSMSAADLRGSSQYIASCDACASDGQVVCTGCSGTLRTPCSECKGAGKAYGYASNGSRRLMNCKSCKGKGDLKCTACDKGKVTCTLCHGAGRRARWLEVVETARHDVQVEPDGQITRAFAWGSDGTEASGAEIQADAKIVAELSAPAALARADIARIVPSDWLANHWQGIQPKLATTERVRTQTFWLLEVPSIELSYALGGSSPQIISFEGRRMLAPPPSLDRQFAIRAQRLRLTRYVAIGLAAAVPISYLIRGSYFWSGWTAGLAVALLCLAITVEGFMRQATLARRAARNWAFGTAAAALLACVFAVGAEPSARAAKRYVAAGNLDTARAELMALGHYQEPSHAAAWAQLHLAQCVKTTEPAAASREAAVIPAATPERAKADQHVFDLVSLAVDKRLSQHDAAGARAVVDETSATMRVGPDASLAPRVAELTARVYDEQFRNCDNDACRWAAASGAERSASSPVRHERLQAARTRLIGALTARETEDHGKLVRLQQLDAVTRLALAVGDNGSDPEVAATAHSAAEWARAERSQIALFGADRAVAAALLGLPTSDGNIIAQKDTNVAVYCSMRSDKCSGVYIVGADGDRVLNDGSHAAATARLVSQTLGHHVSLPDPPTQVTTGTQTVSKWREGNLTIATRWRGADMMELRLGEAQP